MQTETDPSIAPEGSTNTIRNRHRLESGCLAKPDGQISAPRVRRVRCPPPPPPPTPVHVMARCAIDRLPFSKARRAQHQKCGHTLRAFTKAVSTSYEDCPK